MRGYILLSLLLSAQYALGQNPQIFSTLQLRYGENSRIEYEQKMDIYKVRVSKNSNYYHGICDNDGKEIISPEYDIVYTHYDNFFVMNKDGKAGAARRDGTIILPCRYTNISPKDDFLVVAKGPVVGKTLQYGWDVYSQRGAYNLNGEEIIPCRYSIIVYSLGNYSLADLSEYVIKQVKRQSVVVNNKKQTPSISVSIDYSGDWKTMKVL